MKMHEFGKENKQKILLLHGAGCTYKMWTPQIEVLQKEYHVYAPTMSGHELNDVDFISSTHEAELIITWFQKHGINDLLLICGASLGAHVAAEILQKQRTFAQYAMIESGNYQIKQQKTKIFAETMILYGSKEKKECKSNTEILQKQIEKCTIVEIPKYRHGELAIGNHRFAGMTGEAVSVRNGKSHIHYVYAKTEISDGHRHEFQVATLIEDPIGEIEEDK